MRRSIAAAAGLVVLAGMPAAAQKAADEGGVVVRRPSLMRNLVPAVRLEKVAEDQYAQLKAQATSRNALVPGEDAQAKRIQRIAEDLLPHTKKWNARAKDWKWEVIVVKTPAINAFCMPGGKIAVFTGIIDALKLTDDEAAMVIGHEMAHALREHARARAVKSTLTDVGAFTVGLLIGGNMGEIARQGGGLLTLKFNRDDERDADLIGMELAARAGYNPEAGVTLWQKMSQVAKGQPPPWLSTHPSGDERVQRIRLSLKQVMPLYEKARVNRPSPPPAAPPPSATAPTPPTPAPSAN
jgi:predicted Zn-dependent protease